MVRGNYIGVNAAGGAAVGNTNSGITIQTSATGNTIGGTAAGEGNLISGNPGTGITVQSSANGNTIQGNLIGLNAAGAQALGNGTDGIRLNTVSATIIGGTTAGARNVISGNTTGIQLQTGATGTLIQGNRIGTNAIGMNAVPNGAGINVSSASGNTIGTAGAGGGNQISGNTGNGIWINAADNNVVRNNLIGVAANLIAAVPNSFGVFVMGANNTIAFNMISGNTNTGVSVATGATGTVILNNLIGVAPSGTDPLPNGGHGVFLDGTGTTVGGTAGADSNQIANNGLAGVRVNSGTGHAVLRNAIFGNGGLGIDVGAGGVTPNDAGDVDTGANNLQNFPVLAGVPGGVQGTLNSTASTAFTIQYFANAACDASGNGEGQTFLGEVSVTTVANGNATLPLFNAAAGAIVTATATSAANDTSEFSACVTVPAAPRASRPLC